MSSSGGFTFARSHSGDRFYNPPAMRRQHQQQQQLLLQQQQQQQQKQVEQQEREVQRSRKTKVVVESSEAEIRRESEDSTSSKTSVCSSPPPSRPTDNLDRFLESVTPMVSAQYLSKTSLKELRTLASDINPYFNLGDLWESFKEWSVYGAGVPLVMNERDSVMQYYVPYLSGIQLYVDPSKPPLRFRRRGEDSDAESPRETSSEGSSDSDVERQSKLGQEGLWNQQNRLDMTRLSSDDKLVMGSNSHGGEVRNPQGLLIFQYMERESPFCREPLSDKVSILSSRFPELKTYNSFDLLPSSWISVAWYPIYRIPLGPTLRDLDACFLTFHSLSTRLQSSNCQPQLHPASVFGKANTTTSDPSMKLPLPIFGLASYKFKGSVWTPVGLQERQQGSLLLQTADNWLRLLDADHPDYKFFTSQNTFRR